MHIKESISEIEIIDNDSSDSIYTIPKASLGDVLNEVDGRGISDWINQLIGKTWIKRYILYEVAQITVREFPKNKINWQSTFFMVEKHFHDEEVRRKVAIEDPSIEKDAITSLFNSIQIGIKESNENTRDEILKKVDDSLKKYEIIKK